MSKMTIAIELILRSLAWMFCALSLCPAGYGQAPRVRSEEVREFEILVNGKPAGTSTATITEAENGLATACTDAFVTLNYVVYSYRYEFHGREVWQENQLLSVENRAVDGGTQLATSARSDLHGSQIQAQGKPSVAGPVLSMTTSYWRVPQGQKGCVLKLLDADQGNVHTVRIDDIVLERLVIGGNQLECTHYRLGGDLVANLWFDARHRLVRQQTTEDGHPVEMRLSRIETKTAPSSRP
jgi:Family of unknown function (DUF6134)